MRAGTMTGAAELLSIGQPAISYQISTFEADVGFPLFQRVKGKIVPTPEAYQLLAEVDRLYDGLSGIEEAARDIAGHQRSILRVLLTSTFSNPKVVGAIARFVASHRGLRIDIDVAHRGTVIRNVANGIADVGVVSLPVSAGQTAVVPLFVSELVCVLPTTHPLLDTGRQGALTPDQLTGHSVIAMKPGGVIRPIVERWFTSAGLQQTFDYEVRDAWAAIELVRAGLGVTVVSRSSASSQIYATDDRLTTLPIDRIEDIQVGAIMPDREGGNRTASSLLEYLKGEELQ